MTGSRGYRPDKRDAIMNKAEYRTKLKHQLEIGRRLEHVGLYTAATESRKKAQVLFHIFRRQHPTSSIGLH
jgi:hypothetical protein